MSTRLSRRTFIGLASGAAFTVGTGGIPARAQSTSTLAAEVVTVEHGFALRVTFSVGSLGSEPLFIQVADSRGVEFFFTWDSITESSGTDDLDIGPDAIQYGRTCLVTIVTATGEQLPLSPVVQVDVPGFPEATF